MKPEDELTREYREDNDGWLIGDRSGTGNEGVISQRRRVKRKVTPHPATRYRQKD